VTYGLFLPPYAASVVTIVTSPDWPIIVTAIGTVAVAVVAVGIAFFTERRSDKRLGAEHARSDKMLAEERALSEARLREERQLLQDREQLAEAYAVQVVLMRGPSESREAHSLAAIIVNHGSYTITQIEARFSPDGQSVISHRRQVRIPGYSNLPPELTDPVFDQPAEAASYGDRLTPWDTGMSIATDEIGVQRLTDPRVIVRWTDRWGTRWEHKRGEIQKVADGAPWSA
jgi:hypothetical protein